MSKANPKTIADLDIIWTFIRDYVSPFKTMEIFNTLNPDLIKFRIRKGNYIFQIGSETFTVPSYSESLAYFFEDIVFQTSKFVDVSKQLDRFELISENTFRIHFK